MTVIWEKRMAVRLCPGRRRCIWPGRHPAQTLWILALTALPFGLVLFFRRLPGPGHAGVAPTPKPRRGGPQVWQVKAASFALAGALGGLALL